MPFRFARVSTYPPNVKYVGEFREAQRVAKSRERGLWQCRDKRLEEKIGEAFDEALDDPDATGGSKCDEHYPDVCIPPYPPDLDCDEIDESFFQVIEPDPHDFDSESETPDDKVGCET